MFYLKKNYFIVGGLVFITFASLFIFVEKTFSYFSMKSDLEEWERIKESQIVESNNSYKQLLKVQAERNWRDDEDEVVVEEAKRAVGKQKLHIIYVKSVDFADYEIDGLINVLSSDKKSLYKNCNDADCVTLSSLNYMETFINGEAKKYDKDVDFEVETHGVYEIENLTKVGDPMQSWGKDPFAMLKLRDDFENLIEERNLAIPKDELVVFLYFDETMEMGSEKIPYSFYEYKKFRSFAVPEVGRAYINVYDFKPRFSVDLVEILIHETLHLYGAVDHYIESSGTGACSSRGRGAVEDYYIPQTTGDIMCLFVENPEGHFERGSIEKGNLVINKVTAADIGWVE